ncbi:MAG: hypothetical protein IJR44_04160, partial [Neisseriaceae bacterium]|nr:hypothetical protein [Neisseriaceae bacterium]
DNLNALRDAAKAAVQAIGTGDSAYNGLKNDLNSAANYVRGTTFEQAKSVIDAYNVGVTGPTSGNSLPSSTEQQLLKALNAARSMNNLAEVKIESSLRDWSQEGAEALLIYYNQHNTIEHHGNNATQSGSIAQGVVSNIGYGDWNPITGWVDDSTYFALSGSLGHRIQALNPALTNTAFGLVSKSPWQFSVMLTLEGNSSNTVNKLNDNTGTHNTPKTIEWPAEGYLPYSMMPNDSWTVPKPSSGLDSIWSFSAYNQSLSSPSVTVSKNGSTIANFSSSQVSAIPSNGTQGWEDNYSTIAFNMSGKVSNPGNHVDDYLVTVKANGGYEYSYHIYVFNDITAAQTHASASVTVLSPTVSTPEQNLSGSLNEPETVITGSEQSDVAQIAELSANAAVNMNAGDDAIEIAHYLGGDIDGGDGFDAVVLTGGTNALSGNHLHDVEMIDLGNAETPNVLSLTASDLLENHDVDGCLWILGQAGNRVALLDGITASDNTVEKDGELFHQYTYTTNGSTYAVMIGDDLYQNNGVVI